MHKGTLCLLKTKCWSKIKRAAGACSVFKSLVSIYRFLLKVEILDGSVVVPGNNPARGNSVCVRNISVCSLPSRKYLDNYFTFAIVMELKVRNSRIFQRFKLLVSYSFTLINENTRVCCQIFSTHRILY